MFCIILCKSYTRTYMIDTFIFVKRFSTFVFAFSHPLKFYYLKWFITIRIMDDRWRLRRLEISRSDLCVSCRSSCNSTRSSKPDQQFWSVFLHFPFWKTKISEICQHICMWTNLFSSFSREFGNYLRPILIFFLKVHTKSQIDQTETVQRKGVRFATGKQHNTSRVNKICSRT